MQIGMKHILVLIKMQKTKAGRELQPANHLWISLSSQVTYTTKWICTKRSLPKAFMILPAGTFDVCPWQVVYTKPYKSFSCNVLSYPRIRYMMSM